MKNNITEMVFILDRSGSMAGLEKDVIGGFNSMIKKQRGEEGEAYVTTVLFDTEFTRLHDRIKLSEVPEMTENEYDTRGCTALFDAVGDTVRHIAHIHKYSRPEDVPEKTIVVITTDGMENSSRRYDREKIKRLIEHEKEKYGWEFIFMGANIDAAETAQSMGIDEERAANFMADDSGIDLCFDAVDNAVRAMRCCEALPADWKQNVERDHANRRNR